ncbi:RING finger protein 150 [Tupaia chinensis]|uniref:RING finger protein 150 n=1 Tax=Tupaia chinensis TaxID=246437 RepID=L9L2K5_TUPCH|nr:RING finger protein 150 [Tupaia chinensis]
MSLIQACRSLALSTWLLSFCFVHLLCLDFTVAEKEEWYTAFVNITYAEPASAPEPGVAAAGGGAELHTEKTECGRYGEHSPKQDARGEVVMATSAHDRLACDPNTKFAAPTHGKNWIALIPKGNCTYRDKIRNAFLQNASAVVIFNVGSNTNETITMPHAGPVNFSPRHFGELRGEDEPCCGALQRRWHSAARNRARRGPTFPSRVCKVGPEGMFSVRARLRTSLGPVDRITWPALGRYLRYTPCRCGRNSRWVGLRTSSSPPKTCSSESGFSSSREIELPPPLGLRTS